MYKVEYDKPERILDIAKNSKEIIVDLAYANTNNFTGEIVPGYLKNTAYLDSKALEALLLANKYFLNIRRTAMSSHRSMYAGSKSSLPLFTTL